MIVPLRTLARAGHMTVTIGRRELLAALSGAAAWPLVAQAQQATMPVIGWLSNGPAEGVRAGPDPEWLRACVDYPAQPDA